MVSPVDYITIVSTITVFTGFYYTISFMRYQRVQEWEKELRQTSPKIYEEISKDRPDPVRFPTWHIRWTNINDYRRKLQNAVIPGST